ncbi:MAG: DUF2270 domain-containing protein [Pyrinomonadaceae bacterium]
MKSESRPRTGTGSLISGERTSGRLRPPILPERERDSIERTVIPNIDRSVAPNIDKTAAPNLGATLRKLSPAEFNTAMIHFYRGEVQRSNTWRNRLDTTTNWAVITAGATLSFAFSSPANPHFVIIINSVLVAYFLFMEARRYRYYEIWSSRVRVLETGYFAQLLTPTTMDQQWAEHLASDLMTPHFTISEWEAVGRRLRRNYLWIFLLLALSWNLKVYLHPQPALNFQEFIARASVGSFIPGWLIFVFGVVFNAALLIFAIVTVRLREATGEVLPRHQFSLRTFGRMTGLSRVAQTTRRASRRAQKARQRVRTGSATGEFKRFDITEPPDKKAPTL